MRIPSDFGTRVLKRNSSQESKDKTKLNHIPAINRRCKIINNLSSKLKLFNDNPFFWGKIVFRVIVHWEIGINFTHLTLVVTLTLRLIIKVWSLSELLKIYAICNENQFGLQLYILYQFFITICQNTCNCNIISWSKHSTPAKISLKDHS